MFPNGFLPLFAVSMACCAIGFVRTIWFMSVGYGFSVAGIGAALLVMSITGGRFELLFTVQCVLFVIYGLRLGLFLFLREWKNVSYRKRLDEIGGNMKLPIFVAAAMWIFMGSLYVCQCAGSIYRLLNHAGTNAALAVGIVVSAAGIVIEAAADRQKGEAKKIDPDMPAMHGLYRLCRCPNYFGEIVFWTGVFISGFGAVSGAQWITALLGYGGILVVMLSGAKRVEARHIRNYGKKPEYNRYADTTPLLFPLVPLYHMTSAEKLAAEEMKKAKKKHGRA